MEYQRAQEHTTRPDLVAQEKLGLPVRQRVPLGTLDVTQNLRVQGNQALKNHQPASFHENHLLKPSRKNIENSAQPLPKRIVKQSTSTSTTVAIPAFSIYEDEPDNHKRQRLSSISESRPDDHESKAEDDDIMGNLENLPPAKIPDIARMGFRETDESILTNSPLSGDLEYSDGAFEVDEEVVEAIDDRNAIFDVDNYTLDVVEHMKNVERNYLAKWNYMEKQPDITYVMRTILVDWLVEVGEEYRLNTETLFLAVNYIDRFLSFMSVQRAKLQLVGTAAIFVAAKYEEIYPPDVSEFCYITDNTYTKQQVLRMEHLILDVLGFRCSAPSANFFVNHFTKLAGCPEDSDAKFLAQYLSELTLLDAQTYLHFLPSIIGAASVALARHTLGLPAWTSAMVTNTGYNVDDFKECLICLHSTFTKAPESPQQAVREKYSSQKFRMVSELKPTPIF